MQLFHINEYQYLIHLKRKYSWQQLRNKAKVTPGTYSETFASKIYTSVFKYSTNLVEEYKKYYKKEYEDIKQFLFWRYGVSEEILGQIANIKNSYLAVFSFVCRIDEDEILKESIKHLFRELEGKK